MQVYTQNVKNPQVFRNFSYPTFCDLRAQNTVFAGVLAHNFTMVGFGQGETARRAFAAIVSSDYFTTLGVPPSRGRGFLPAEEIPGADIAVTVVSHAYWQKTGFDSALVGRTIRVNERPFTIVGIAPEGFAGTMMLLGPELYFPLGVFDALANDFNEGLSQGLNHREAYRLFVVGRLKPGLTPAGAALALAALATRFAESFPLAHRGQTFLTGRLPRLSSSSSPTAEEELAAVGALLLGMGLVVLLVASLNLAGMLLAREAARRREFAIRLALGGGRGRIMRQLLVEGGLLTLTGGVAGFVLAAWSTRLLADTFGRFLPIPVFIHGVFSPAVVVAAVGFCVVSALFFAVSPALRLSRVDVVADLKDIIGDAAPARHNPWRPRHPLVTAQLALSVALLAVAGLFVRSALHAARVDLGFKADDTLVLEADAGLAGQSPVQSARTYGVVATRIRALPGVESVGIASTIPFGNLNISRPVQIFGVSAPPGSHPATAAEGLAYNARWNSVDSGYFATLGLPLMGGRPFTDLESANTTAPAFAIIDNALALKLWPDGSALGRRIRFAPGNAPRAAGGSVESAETGESEDVAAIGELEDVPARSSDPASLEIVGIVPTVRAGLFGQENGSAIYVPFAKGIQSQVYLHVRLAPGADRRLADVLRREFRAAAPGVPVFKERTFRQHLDASPDFWIARSAAAVFAGLGGLALLLAVISVYGSTAYNVSRRTREIGVRMALGATPADVLRLVLGECALQVGLAGIAGLGLALGVGWTLSSLLCDISPFDPLTLSSSFGLIAIAVALATFGPARRATHVDPVTALRAE